MVEDEEGSWELVMPFVVCASQGGPYDDEAFVAGIRLQQLWHRLEVGDPDVLSEYVPPELVPQLDLLAMHLGYTLTAEPHNEDWALVAFRREDEG